MHDETVELDERSVIEEQMEPFAGGKLSFRVLRLEAVGTAAELRFRDATLELLELFAHGHRPEIVSARWRSQKTIWSRARVARAPAPRAGLKETIWSRARVARAPGPRAGLKKEKPASVARRPPNLLTTNHQSPITSHRHQLSIGGSSSGTNPSSCVSSIGSTTGGVSGRGG